MVLKSITVYKNDVLVEIELAIFHHYLILYSDLLFVRSLKRLIHFN